jgi:3',5'-cyclic AMP phosphodiesterase CpdA
MPAPGERRDRHALPNAALAVALLLPILIPAPAAADDAAAARAPRRRVAVDPEGLVSREAMLATLGELTAIGADGFYRTAASRGEAEALDWLEARLRALPFLATRVTSAPVITVTPLATASLSITVLSPPWSVKLLMTSFLLGRLLNSMSAGKSFALCEMTALKAGANTRS